MAGFFSGEKSQSPVKGRPNPEAKPQHKGPGPTDNDGADGAMAPKKGSSQPKPPKAAAPKHTEGQPAPMEKKAPIGHAQQMKQVLMALALRQHMANAAPPAGPPGAPNGPVGPPRPPMPPPGMGAPRPAMPMPPPRRPIAGY